MSLPKEHITETKSLLKKISKANITKWLLEEGYYPEQYVMPPCFKIKKFELQADPYFQVDTTGLQPKFDPEKSDLINISFPKGTFLLPMVSSSGLLIASVSSVLLSG